MTYVSDSLSLFCPHLSQFLCYLMMPKVWNSLSQLPCFHETFKNFIALRLPLMLVHVYTHLFVYSFTVMA